MRSRRYFKKAMAGLSAVAIGATTICPAAPVFAAEIVSESATEVDTEETQETTQETTVEGESETTTELNTGFAARNAEEINTYSADLNKDAIVANDYVLYTVNCGTPDSAVIPNQPDERMGILQSNVDQPYGVDATTGRTWGYDSSTQYSSAVRHGDDATDIGNSYVYMDSNVMFDKYKSSLGYSFEVPTETMEGIEADTYEVTVAFKHYWDNRLVNISLEGQTVATDVGLDYGTWVSRTFKTKVTDGNLNVQISAPRRTDGKGDPILNYIKVRALEDTEPEVPIYDSITGAAGASMYDTSGKLIQAHGGQIQQLTVQGVTKWYWIGEDKTNDYRPCGGIRVYSSVDLYNWDDEGVVLQTMENKEQITTDDYFNSLYGALSDAEQEDIFIDLDKNNCVMERPKMLYNEKTDQYVIWFHADGRTPGSDADYGKAKAGIAVSDSPAGPFKLLGSYKLNYHDDPNADQGYDGWNGRGSVRDMNLFKDDDGTAYVVYSSEGNKTTFVSKLNEDYTGLAVDRDEAVEGIDFTRHFQGWSREAPAMFKYKEKYYMVNSGCTGWSPNPAEYAVADHPMGPWTGMGDPCPDWGSQTTYDTQSTCVFPVDAANGKYIYMGDRWNAGDLSESRYVWLPVEFKPDNQISIDRYDNWTLDELNGKGLFEVASKLPEVVNSVDEISGLLPKEVTISYGSDEEVTPVTWDISVASPGKLGTVSVTGTLTDKGRTFTHEIAVVNKDTMYFFDSSAESSNYFDKAKERLGKKLLNNVADQKYSKDVKAGYQGVPKAGDSESFDMDSHIGAGLWETGWWAAPGKNIEYVFDLEAGDYNLAAGFQEWWNMERAMKMTISADDQILAEQTFALTNTEKALQLDQAFTLTEAKTVKVTISKTADADPVISWIALMGEGGENPEPSVETDMTSLNLAITMAEKMKQKQTDTSCYTAESWAKVEEALTVANNLLKAEDVTQKQADEAFLNLIMACNLVETAVQKAGLEAAIEGTQAILSDTESVAKYTEESVQEVRDALAAAQLVYHNSLADQGTINGATTRLLTAVTSMLVKSDETRLDILIRKAEELLKKEDQYTPSSVAKLKAALEQAKTTAKNPQATKQEMEKAYQDLAKTMTELVRKGNKEELKNALDKANEILKDSSKYMASSIAGLQTVTTEAQTVYDNQEADADTIGEALQKLIKEILKARLLGDVNMNGVVDTQDAAKLLKYNVELETFTDEQLQIADVNGDQVADSSDAVSILEYAAEKIKSF